MRTVDRPTPQVLMNILRWTIAVLFLTYFLHVTIGNFFAMAIASRRLGAGPDATGYYLAPLVGGGVGAVGALIAPHDMVQRLWWVPLILDPGCVLMFGFGAVFVIGHFIRRFTGPRT